MPQTITVDITPDEKTIYRRPTLYFSQGDVGREFRVNLFSRFDTPIPTTAKIQATKPSGLGFSISGTITDGVAVFVSTLDMTDEAGKFLAELELTDNGIVLGTANFNICVEKNPHPDGTTDGRSEEVIPEITVLVERVEAAAESIHSLSVESTTLAPNTPATAEYDDETNTLSFGIPRGAMLTATDDGNGIITLTFS